MALRNLYHEQKLKLGSFKTAEVRCGHHGTSRTCERLRTVTRQNAAHAARFEFQTNGSKFLPREDLPSVPWVIVILNSTRGLHII